MAVRLVYQLYAMSVSPTQEKEKVKPVEKLHQVDLGQSWVTLSSVPGVVETFPQLVCQYRV